MHNFHWNKWWYHSMNLDIWQTSHLLNDLNTPSLILQLKLWLNYIQHTHYIFPIYIRMQIQMAWIWRFQSWTCWRDMMKNLSFMSDWLYLIREGCTIQVGHEDDIRFLELARAFITSGMLCVNYRPCRLNSLRRVATRGKFCEIKSSFTEVGNKWIIW